MRPLSCAALPVTLPVVALLLTAPHAVAGPSKPAPKAPAQSQAQAVAAERYAVRASYVSGGHGYSARARRITACLAAYPTYDWRTDRVRVRPGVTHPCELQAP